MSKPEAEQEAESYGHKCEFLPAAISQYLRRGDYAEQGFMEGCRWLFGKIKHELELGRLYKKETVISEIRYIVEGKY